MANHSWTDKYNLKLVPGIVEIKWEGITLPLTPSHREIFLDLLRGPICLDSYCPNRSRKSTIVLISQMRSLLEDVGFPLKIKNLQGRRLGMEYYTFVEQPSPGLGVPGVDGGDHYEHKYTANSRADRL